MRLKLQLLAVFTALMLFAPLSQAAKLKQQNLKQLITGSESILSGQVVKLEDGVTAKGMPYTEVTIKVNTAAKGQHAKGSTYTFRQFGLMAPRTLANGKKLIAVAPEGFPRWNKDETVIVFMHEAAKLTGLRTTAGMAHGKFNIYGGKATNEFNNHGLFENIEFVDGLLSQAEKEMLNNPGAYKATDFMSLVGKAVAEDWIGKGKMK